MKKEYVSIAMLLMGVVETAPVFAQENTESAGDDVLGEVVVTAERRIENLQKTPIAISTFSGDQLREANVARPEDLQRLIPGLAVSRAFGGMNNFYLRGIGSQIVNAFGDQSIAQSLDGVYVARGTALSGAFLDSQRVEVLKGPQGTLYGRNATGGAINYISNRPTFANESGAAIQLGNYGDTEASGFLNAKLSDTTAVRAAVGYVNHDGYIRSSGANDQDTLATRVSLNFAPRENMSVLLIGDYSRDNGSGTGSVVLDPAAGHARAVTADPWSGPPLGFYAPANYDGTLQNPGVGCTLFPGANQCVPPNTVHFDPTLYGGAGGWALNANTVGVWARGSTLANRNWGVMSQLDIGIADVADLTILPAYRKTVGHWTNTASGYNTMIDTPAGQTSLEMRLGSTGSSRLKWLTGLYYYRETQDPHEDYWNFNQVPGGLITNQGNVGRDYHLTDESYAAFAQSTWSFTDALRGTLGVRYTSEKKTGSGPFHIDEPAYTDIGGTPFCPVGLEGTTYNLATSQCIVPLNGAKSWNTVNWRAGFEYDLTSSSMVYLNASTGFHAGGLNDGIKSATYAAGYEPEKILAWALGSKNRFLADRLQVNAEAFLWDFKDKQYGALSVLNPPVVGFPILNVGDLREYGMDVDLDYLVTPNDRFGVTFEYLHTKFDDYVFTPTSIVNCGAPVGLAPVLQIPVVNCAGKPVPNAPQWSVTASFQHTFNLENDRDLVLGLRSHLQSETDLTIGAPVWAQQRGYSKSDIWLTFNSGGERFSVTAYVNNLENTETYTNAQQSFNSNDPTWWGDIAPPRTYGARARVRF